MRKERESWEDFQERLGISFGVENEARDEARDEDEYWASFFYFNSMYCSEQGLNWRRQIVRMKKVIKAIRENDKNSN
jgi:hypothetical protein